MRSHRKSGDRLRRPLINGSDSREGLARNLLTFLAPKTPQEIEPQLPPSILLLKDMLKP